MKKKLQELIKMEIKSITRTISYRLQPIESKRFMPRSLSNPVNNLYEGIHKIKCKYGHDEGKYKTCKIIHKGCDCFLE